MNISRIVTAMALHGYTKVATVTDKLAGESVPENLSLRELVRVVGEKWAHHNLQNQRIHKGIESVYILANGDK